MLKQLNKTLFRLHVSGYYFTPKLITTSLFLIVLIALLNLGFWQLRRADEKAVIHAAVEARKVAAPLTLKQAVGRKREAEYYPISMRGRYLNDQQFLLDNRVMKGRVGYEVLTPFVPLSMPNRLVIIDRGWIPANRDRSQLPTLEPVMGLQHISGTVKLPPEKHFVLKEHTPELHWPYVVQTLDLSKMTKAIERPMQPFIVLLAPAAPHGYVREWKFIHVSSHKHLGYAIQWFALGLTLVIIYFFANISRGSNDGSREEE